MNLKNIDSIMVGDVCMAAITPWNVENVHVGSNTMFKVTLLSDSPRTLQSSVFSLVPQISIGTATPPHGEDNLDTRMHLHSCLNWK